MPNLVGIGLSQVPTNSMLGGLAYQDPEHASIKDLDLKNLSQINSEISDTAVDVFVYDTRKDSDGGAWRKRTQHTSWYNETLGTSTRGTRREFPSVAVIVSTTAKVTIYDGDDPDLPMWMVFNAGSNGINNVPLLQYSGQNGYHLAALNGILVIGEDTNGDNWGSPIINFISEYIVRMDPHSTEGGIFNGGVAQRHDNVGFNSPGKLIIVNSQINDVAMTVLPNAPIDDATGLPVPTIAVATDGGVSIIKDDGTVVDWTETAGPDSAHRVNFRKDNKLGVYTSGTSGATAYPQLYYIDLPSSDISSNYYYNFSALNFERYGGTAWETNATNNLVLKSPGSSLQVIILLICDTPNLTYAATNGGLNAIIRPEAINYSTGRAKMFTAAVAYIQNDYNTGYMYGDIKGAFLSDTDTTNVTGTSLIANGDLSSNSTAAFTTVAGGTAEVTGGLLKLTDTGGTFVYASAPFTTVIGNQYFVTVDIVNNSNTAPSNYIRCGNSHNGTEFHNTNYGTSYGTKTFYFTATATTTYLTLISGHGAGNPFGHWDNIFVYKLDNDRSVNSKGLQVYGTVSKQVVATGADLVSYGPFNNNNNFRQPYNSDLRFEQNDFSIMFWIYDTGVNQHCTLISKDEREFDISRLSAAYGNKLRIYTRNSSETLRGPDSSSALPFNKWVCVCVTYTGGNTKRVYLDGKLDNTIAGSNGEYDIDSTTYGLNIGVRNTGGTKNYSADGVKLALMRISGSAPSAEQIKKIYEDEKVLFQENAKATLYGSSNAVTGLAHDDSTDSLYVGTSAGRSEFQGLRRINNTTTAVTTAISASNGLVAEQ